MTVRDSTVSVFVGVLVMAVASYTFVTIATKTSTSQPVSTQSSLPLTAAASAQAVNSSEQTLKEIQAELSDLRKRLPAEPHSIPTISLSKPAANVDRPSEDELRALRDMQAELLDLRRRLAIEPPSAAASETLKPAVNAASPLEGERRSSQPTGLQSIAVALPLDTNSTEREVVNPGGSRAQTPNHNLELASSKREVPKAVPTAQPETHPTKKGDSVAQPGRATGGKVYRITINTRPEGGKIVERGGKTYKAGTAILAGPGNHSFVISNPGYQTKSIDVSIADADKSITIELVKSAIEKY